MKKKIAIYAGMMYLSVLMLSITGCSSDKKSKEIIQEVEAANHALEQRIEQIGSSYSSADADSILALCDKPDAELDEEDLNEEEQKQYAGVKANQQRLKSAALQKLLRKSLTVMADEDSLISATTIFPVYLEKDDELKYHFESEHPFTLNVYNGNSQRLLASFKKTTEVTEQLSIRYGAVYLVEIIPTTRQYMAFDIAYQPRNIERLRHPKYITTNIVNCEKKDFMARTIHGIKMKNAFEEVRKFTLRGNLKALFSGNSRAIVPIQVTAGAKDILYSLTISTNETAGSTDKDEFYRDMSTSYTKVKLLGLPLYESNRGAGLLSTLLGLNLPVRDEDAYINMYVFFNAAQARKFQNGDAPNTLKYSLDYSTLGTQSCNGRIPCAGYKTVYLGFENERMRYNNYVWVSALLSVPKTEYVREEYVLSDTPESED